MTFKEQVLIDARQTFLNPNEFSDPHMIDGKQIICQVDSDEFLERANTTASLSGSYVEGVFSHGIVIYANTDDFLNAPVSGQRLRVDGRFYYVLSVQEEYGVIIITASANES